MKIAGRYREVVAARHRDSLEINSTLLAWSSWIARTNSLASNTFLSRSRSGIFVSTASSFYRRSRAPFVFRSTSFRALLFPREQGNWLLLLADDIPLFSLRSSKAIFDTTAYFVRARMIVLFSFSTFVEKLLRMAYMRIRMLFMGDRGCF